MHVRKWSVNDGFRFMVYFNVYCIQAVVSLRLTYRQQNGMLLLPVPYQENIVILRENILLWKDMNYSSQSQ